METLENPLLFNRARAAIELQQQGRFLIGSAAVEIGGLPFPHYETVQLDTYQRRTPWGRFEYNSETLCYVLTDGTPPEELLPQPTLLLAEAQLHEGYALVQTGNETIEIPIQSGNSSNVIYQLNKALYQDGLPVVVWKAQVASEGIQVCYLTNDSAMVYAGSAVWSPEENQLVAAWVATSSAELLKAIRASLAKNSNKSWLNLRVPGSETLTLQGAKRGYTAVSSNLSNASAQGLTSVLVHPLAGNPADAADGFFYIIATTQEQLTQLFSERLDLAIPWPLQPEWAEYLSGAGLQYGLVELLPSCGETFLGLRVSKDETAWKELISQGLQEGAIRIASNGD